MSAALEGSGPQTPRRGIDMSALMNFLASIGSYAGPEMILSPERELFHYTDLSGLLGILQNGDLWLTDSRYSNDEEEMAHGQRIAVAVVQDQLKAATDEERRAYLQSLEGLIARPAAQGVYICCFCRRDNLLSQWRGYGDDDFSEEEEWRMIFTPHLDCAVKLRFRVRGTMLVPYYSLRDLSLPAPPAAAPGPAPLLPIRGITVGPTANKGLNVASVRLLLERLGYAPVPVEASATPYRS